MRRNTQEDLIAMKKNILDACINKQIKCKDGAKTLSMHSKSFSCLKKRYIQHGESVLVPKNQGQSQIIPHRTKRQSFSRA